MSDQDIDKLRVPGVLYKYRSLAGDGFRYALDTFARGRIYFARLSEFNDPSEGLASFSDSTDINVMLLSALLSNEALRNHGVYSLSETPDDIVMWAHYADSHRGFCIGFSTDGLASLFATAVKVRYSKGLLLPETFPVEKADEIISELTRLACLSKAEQWAYENEWRIIGKPGIHEISRELIKEIIIGCRTPPAYSTWIRHWASLYTPTASLLRTQLKPGSFEIDLGSAGVEESDSDEFIDD